jgi:hypothetical protein
VFRWPPVERETKGPGVLTPLICEEKTPDPFVSYASLSSHAARSLVSDLFMAVCCPPNVMVNGARLLRVRST